MVSLGIIIGSLLTFFGYIYYTNNGKKKGKLFSVIGAPLIIISVVLILWTQARDMPGSFIIPFVIDREITNSFLYAALIILAISFYKKINPIQKMYNYWKKNYKPLIIIAVIIISLLAYAQAGHFMDASVGSRRTLGNIAEISIKLLAIFTCLTPFKE